MEIISIDVDYFFNRSIPEPNSGCWLWDGAVSSNGYGSIRCDGKTLKAHRKSYEVFYGEKIAEDKDACHKCDVRCCVNPEHIFIGTRKENMADCISKERFSFIENGKGESSPSSKLTESEVISIRNDKRSTRVLGRIYGVDRRTISFIKKRITWSHI